METFDAITSRKSIRSYTDQPVSDDLLRKCLEASRWAPSGGNTQPWEFVIVRDSEKKARFDPYHRQPWVENAPVIVVCCLDPTTKWKKYDESMENYYIGFLDMGAAIQNFLLTAHDEGLGAVWVAAFSPKKVRELCCIPEHVMIVSLICLGYYEQKGALTFREKKMSNQDRRPRKAIIDISYSEIYGNILFDEGP